MRKLAASLMVFTFVAAALVASFFGGSTSSAQDAPLLTATPSHTPIFTPLAMLNANFEGGHDEQGKPFGWNDAGTQKTDRVKCIKGIGGPGSTNLNSDLRGQNLVNQEVNIGPPPEVCSFVFKGERRSKTGVLYQDVPITSSFQIGQPIAIGAEISGKNLAGNRFTLEGVLYFTYFWEKPGKIRVSQVIDFVTNNEIRLLYLTAKLETLGSNMIFYRPVWLRLKLKYRGSSGQLNVGNVQANALIPSPTPTASKTPPGQSTPPCAGEDCPLPVRLTPTPFPFPTLPPGPGGE
jgi:hypothetical protein